MVFKRQTEGSVVCTSCGKLVAVTDEKCWHCGRRNPGLWGYAAAFRALGDDLGFTRAVIGVCLFLYVLMLAAFPDQISNRGILSFLSPGSSAAELFGASGYLPIFGGGRFWTVLSAGLLHGGLIHIGFNLYWLNQLGPLMAKLYGPGRAMILFVATSVAGFVVTSAVAWINLNLFGIQGFRRLSSFGLGGAPITLGASAAIFGWIGCLVYYGRRTGSSLFSGQLMGFIVPLFLIGFLLPGVDNWAHIGGFAGGYFFAKRLDPMRPERIDHIVLGLALFAIMLLSVVVSVVTGWPILKG
ncbi:MAG: rhomboid family intramembrane serine protease [Acidobacteriota bacterium]